MNEHKWHFPVVIPQCPTFFKVTIDIGVAIFAKRPKLSYDRDTDELVLRFKIAEPKKIEHGVAK